MRTWRVGTFSMGLSIISLGCFLLFSVIQGTKVLDSLTAWWPVLLIILGVEILLYLLFSKKEQSFIKYDIFSIFFIGVFRKRWNCFLLFIINWIARRSSSLY